jgi:hypothetical protein
MRRPIFLCLGGTLLLGVTLAGCEKLSERLGLAPNAEPPSTQLPTPEELKRIHYMSEAVGPDRRKYFDHLEQARSCRDLDLAMRWNRPSDVRGGPFDKKMIYLTSQFPSGLPKQSEVFIWGTIERGQSLPSGAWGWSVKLRDGSEVQAIEPAEYWEKQEQEQQNRGAAAAIVKPNEPRRKLCGYGIYQGMIGKSLKGDREVPLISVLFAIDRRR